MLGFVLQKKKKKNYLQTVYAAGVWYTANIPNVAGLLVSTENAYELLKRFDY